MNDNSYDFGYLSLLMAAQKATIRGKEGFGSNGQKGQCPFQPDDVLAGAEGRELEGIGGNWGKFREQWPCGILYEGAFASSGHITGAVADGKGV